MRAKAVVLIVHDGQSHHAKMTFGVDPASTGLYNQYFGEKDEWWRGGRHIAQPGWVGTGESLCPRPILQSSEFYNDFLKRFDTTKMCTAGIDMRAGHLSNISVLRSYRQADFEEHDVALLRFLLPHVQRAIKLHDRFTLLNTKSRTAECTIESLGIGVVFVTHPDRVLLINPIADSIRESTTHTSTFAQSYQGVMKYVSPEAYRSWSDCQRVNAYGVSCWIESANSDSDDQLVFRTKWNPVPGDNGASPKIKNTSIVGAKREGSTVLLPEGTDVALNPSVVLTRTGESTIVAVINTTRGSCPAYSPRPAPIFKPVYVLADPLTGQPYQETVSFDKNSYYTQPPKPRGEGHEIIYTHNSPGSIASIQCAIQPGGGGGWTHQEVCSYQGTVARWEGWSNSGDHATIVLNIQYKMPTQQCEKHCGQ
jgi:hypothetical protein